MLLLLVSMGLCYGCDCIRLPVKNAKREADIVFLGTITSVRNSGNTPRAVFKVTRVWKGNVTDSFEMPALQEVYSCLGFLPKVEVGAEILVYARMIVPSDPDYYPLTCQTTLASKAADQIRDLGSGRKPRHSK